MNSNNKIVSGIFLRESIRKIEYLRRNHIENKHYLQVEKLQKTADEYFEHFRRHQLYIPAQDVSTFADFINTFSYDEKENLLMQLETDSGFAAREYLQRPQHNWWQQLWVKKEAKRTEFITKTANKITSWLSKWQKRIVSGAMVTIISIGGAFLLKNDTNAKTSISPQKSTTLPKLPNSKRPDSVPSKDFDLTKFTQNKQKKSNIKTISEEEQNIWNNFYQNRLNKFIGKSKAETMIANLMTQQQKGIFQLPQDISIRQYLYAAQIYRLYGYKSIAKEMMQVQKSKKAITANVQDKLFNYVRQAGKKGTGVQQMCLAQRANQQLTR